MVKTFKVGDRVSWNSEAERVRGTEPSTNARYLKHSI